MGAEPSTSRPHCLNEELSPSLDLAAFKKLGLRNDQLALIVVDHGSRREASNQLLIDVAEGLRSATGLPIVEPAHASPLVSLSQR